jgi:sarcosine oxidase subunit delta
MLLLPCPNCGERNIPEFHFGGEVKRRPPKSTDPDALWAEQLYMKENILGEQREWWYHRAGCGLWFLAERHTKTQKIVRTYLWEPAL